MNRWSIVAVVAAGLMFAHSGLHAEETEAEPEDPELEIETEAEPDEDEDIRVEEVTVYEVQVRGLPSGGRAWLATRPIRNLDNVRLQNIDMNRSRLVIRVSGELDMDTLEQALQESGLMMVYITERGS